MLSFGLIPWQHLWEGYSLRVVLDQRIAPLCLCLREHTKYFISLIFLFTEWVE